MLWNSEEIRVDLITIHKQFVTVEIHYKRQASWLLTVVYASPHMQRREILWHELQHFASECNKPWLLAGDFNETMSLKERNHGGTEMLRRCSRFKHWIGNNGSLIWVSLGQSSPGPGD